MKNLNEWFKKPLGHAVIEAIQKQWEAFEQLGLSTYGECLQFGTNVPILPIKKITVATPKLYSGTQVVTSTEDLPFADESFSIIFLPFTLEYSQNIYSLLDEVKRVLTPDGIVCIVGINPFSLWGCTRLFHSQVMKLFNTHGYSSLGVYASLKSRNFTIYGIKSFFYRPPISSSAGLKKTRFLEPVGQMFWPYPGGLYFLLAQKITPQWLSVAPLWQSGGYVFGKA
jgi:SAM-dependent methyltransferase